MSNCFSDFCLHDGSENSRLERRVRAYVLNLARLSQIERQV